MNAPRTDQLLAPGSYARKRHLLNVFCGRSFASSSSTSAVRRPSAPMWLISPITPLVSSSKWTAIFTPSKGAPNETLAGTNG